MNITSGFLSFCDNIIHPFLSNVNKHFVNNEKISAAQKIKKPPCVLQGGFRGKYCLLSVIFFCNKGAAGGAI